MQTNDRTSQWLHNLIPFTTIAALCTGLAACPASSSPLPAGDAGLPDTGTTSGYDAAAGDGSVTHDASPPVWTADAGPLVLACQTAANNFATLCAGSDPRPCSWHAYAALCATGHTQLLIDAMKCLDNTTCRTFSDPNEGETCVTQLIQNSESALAKSTVQAYCSECDAGASCTANAGSELFPYLLDSDLAVLSTCIAGSCTTLPPTCTANPSIAPFTACGQ